MIAEHGELAVRRVDLGEVRREAMNVGGAYRDEVAAEQKDVGIERVERAAGFGEQRVAGRGAGVKIRRERDPERRFAAQLRVRLE